MRNENPTIQQQTGYSFFCQVNFFKLVNPYPAKLIYLNFYPLEVVTCYRKPQLQVGENICLIYAQI